jgi:L,D-transpeptidase ErfK/SrfK
LTGKSTVIGALSSRLLEISGLVSLALLSALLSRSALCEELQLPYAKGDSVVGALRHTVVREGESLLDIARAFDIGHDQIIAANPLLERWVPPPGHTVLIPSLYILPSAPREGIVLNLAEMRLYYYPPGRPVVHTFPVSVGNIDWSTPLGVTKVVAKQRDPAWYPPPSIRREHEAEGDPLPAMIPAGDERNPLGRFALRLGLGSYLIHGTDQSREFGIGMRVSHGCIRLYPEDIERLFELVPIGTTVRIIYEPIKVGWRDGALFIEIHAPNKDPFDDPWPFEYPSVDQLFEKIARLSATVSLTSYRLIEMIFERGNGIPRELPDAAPTLGNNNHEAGMRR